MGGEAPPRLTTLGGLDVLRIETEDGRKLGHVFDLRARYDRARPGEAPVVTEIVYGRRGLLERLGLRHKPSKSIDWSNVVAIRDGVIVVRKQL